MGPLPVCWGFCRKKPQPHGLFGYVRQVRDSLSLKRQEKRGGTECFDSDGGQLLALVLGHNTVDVDD